MVSSFIRLLFLIVSSCSFSSCIWLNADPDPVGADPNLPSARFPGIRIDIVTLLCQRLAGDSVLCVTLEKTAPPEASEFGQGIGLIICFRWISCAVCLGILSCTKHTSFRWQTLPVVRLRYLVLCIAAMSLVSCTWSAVLTLPRG